MLALSQKHKIDHLRDDVERDFSGFWPSPPIRPQAKLAAKLAHPHSFVPHEAGVMSSAPVDCYRRDNKQAELVWNIK